VGAYDQSEGHWAFMYFQEAIEDGNPEACLGLLLKYVISAFVRRLWLEDINCLRSRLSSSILSFAL
jgi:hypothetical protein